MREQQLTFGGVFAGAAAESEMLDRIARERLARLVEALRLSGIRAGTITYKVAVLIHHVTKTSNGRLEWTNLRIARDQYLAKPRGKGGKSGFSGTPSEHSVSRAVRILRRLGIVEQELRIDAGIEFAVRSIDHARVLAIVELGSSENENAESNSESAFDSTFESAFDPTFDQAKTASLYSCKSSDPKIQRSINPPTNEPDPATGDDEDDFLFLEVNENPVHNHESSIVADISGLSPILKAHSNADKSLLREWLLMVVRGELSREAFDQWLGVIIDRKIASPMAYLKTCVTREMGKVP